MYFWHSEGWTLRNEALLEAVVRQSQTTRHPWLEAGDANMCPEDFKSMVSNGADACSGSERSVHMQVTSPKKVSGLKELLTTSLRVTATGEHFHR